MWLRGWSNQSSYPLEQPLPRRQKTTQRRAPGTRSSSTHHVSWLLNFLVTTLPRSSPSRSATFWDRSWWELPLKSTMLGMSENPMQRVREKEKEFNEMCRVSPMEGDENGKISLLMWQAGHCTGTAVGTPSREEISETSCQYLHRRREVPSPRWT